MFRSNWERGREGGIVNKLHSTTFGAALQEKTNKRKRMDRTTNIYLDKRKTTKLNLFLANKSWSRTRQSYNQKTNHHGQIETKSTKK